MSNPSPTPWIGLASYTEELQSQFYGRQEETRKLSRLVNRDVLTVLFAASGLGKTSLIQAALFPKLRAGNYLPVYVRLAFHRRAKPLQDQVLDELQAAALAAGVEAPPITPGESLWEHFHRRDSEGDTRRYWSPSHQVVTPVLVFDQFEELFTLGQRTPQQIVRGRAFVTALAGLIENQPPRSVTDHLDDESDEAGTGQRFEFGNVPLKVILSLREDYLAHLEPLKPVLPAIRRNQMRLSPLTTRQAREVIEEPGKQRGILGPGVADAILEFLSRSMSRLRPTVTALDASWIVTSLDSKGHEDASEQPIDPALLSVFCHELDATRRDRGERRISKELVSTHQEQIIANFYTRAIDGIGQEVRRLIEDELLSPAGFRDSRGLDDILNRPGVSQTEIDQLIERRILRIEERQTGHRRLELSHDLLCSVVARHRDERQREEAIERSRQERDAQDQRRARELAQAQEDERRIREQQELHSRRKQLRVAVGLVVVAVCGFATGVWGWYQADQKADDAETERNIAEQATQEANTSRAQSDLKVAKFLIEQDREKESDSVAYLARALRSSNEHHTARDLLIERLSWRHWGVTSELNHGSALYSVRVDPNGKRLVMTSGKGVSLWDIAKAEPIRSEPPEKHRFNHAEFSPDGNLIAVWSETSAYVWSESSSGRWEFKSVPDEVPGKFLAVTASPNVRWVKQWRETLKIIDHDKGNVGSLSPKGNDEVVRLAFDPLGEHLVAVTKTPDDSPLFFAQVWSVLKQGFDEPIRLEHRPSTAQLADDGNVLLTAIGNKGQVWNTKYHKLVATLEHAGPVHSIRFHSGANRVATASEVRSNSDRVITASEDGSVRIWSLEGNLLAVLNHDGPVHDAEFSPDGDFVVTAAADGKVRIWKPGPFGRPLEQAAALHAAKFTDGGTHLVALARDGSLRVWDALGKLLPRKLPNDSVDNGYSVSSDATRLASLSNNRSIDVFDTVTGDSVATLTRAQTGWKQLRTIHLSPDGKRLVVTFATPAHKQGALLPVACIWEVDAKDASCEALQHTEALVSVVFSPTSLRVAGFGKTAARVWDAGTGDSVVSTPGELQPLHYSPTGDALLVAAHDDANLARVYHWSAKPGGKLGPALDANGGVVSAQYSADASRIAIGTSNGGVRVILRKHTTAKSVIDAKFRGGAVRALSFSHDAGRIAAAHSDGTVRILELGTEQTADVQPNDELAGERTHALKPVELTSVAQFTPAGRLVSALLFGEPGQIITIADDARPRLWDLATLEGAPDSVPCWLTKFAEAVVGETISADGGPEAMELEIGGEIPGIFAEACATEDDGTLSGHPADKSTAWLSRLRRLWGDASPEPKLELDTPAPDDFFETFAEQIQQRGF